MDNPHDPELDYFETERFDLSYYDHAPVKFRYEVELPVTPAVLFDVFEDPTSWPRWAPGIGSVEWTSAKPYAVGTTRTVRFWGGMEVYEEFLAYERGKHMAFRFNGASQLVFAAFGEQYTVTDLGDGRCRLVWQVSYEPTGGFGKVHRVIKPFMKFNLGTYMWWLKRYCRKLPAPATVTAA
jgi:uncharacterized protein YndB with AHSA1/START domain